jgi:hypothetical protein
MFKLEMGDVFVCVNEDRGFIASFSRWAIGQWDHVSMYVGKAFNEVPFLYESNGRGVAIHSLQPQTGRLVTVMRPKIQIQKVIEQAIEIATDPKSYYDYYAIVHSCVPRVLKEKFPWLPIPLQYHRDDAMICSEAVAEAFWKAGINVLPQDVIPLPSDFIMSSILNFVYGGRLLEDIQP